MIVEGSVPRMPPAFVPYFSAITVINITMNAERMNGNIDWEMILSMIVDKFALYNLCRLWGVLLQPIHLKSNLYII